MWIDLALWESLEMNVYTRKRPRKTLLEAPWLGLSQGKLLTSAELVKKLLYCTNMQCTALMVSNVHYKKNKEYLPVLDCDKETNPKL